MTYDPLKNYIYILFCRACIALAAWCSLAALISAATLEISEPFVGVRHIHRVTTVPRELDMQLLEIDMSAPGLDFRVTNHNFSAPGETVAQTTRAFLTQQNAQIAINGAYSHYVSGANMDIEGLAASDGFVYSTFQQFRLDALNISSGNVASIIQSLYGSGILHSPASDLYNVVGGDARVVTDGVNSANPDDINLHPRTAAGVTAAGKLLLLTVDGRNPGHSRGVTTPELGDLMIQFGALNAINLDGGGSTTMVFADPTPRVVNVPVGVNNVPGSERAVGNNLAIFAQPNPGSRSAIVYADFEFADETAYGYSPTSSGSTSGVLASSTATAVPGAGRDGSWGQRLSINDDPASSGGGENPNGWFVRHLSGQGGSGGTRGSNTPRPTEGSVGFWARTLSAGLEVALAIDSTADVTADRGIRLDLIADGQWHRYAWDLEDDRQWDPWFNGDGVIDSADFTIDSIQLFGGNSNATVFIDDVFHDTAPIAAADFNNDGFVDGADLLRWRQSWGLTSGADADQDGDSDGADFLLWQRQFHEASGNSTMNTTIAEPTAGAIALTVVVGALVSSRMMRRRALKMQI